MHDARLDLCHLYDVYTTPHIYDEPTSKVAFAFISYAPDLHYFTLLYL